MSSPVDPTSLTPPTDTGEELPPHLLAKFKLDIPGYQLLSEIAPGGQATVYKARELTSDFTVAIKLLHAGPYADPQSRERFQREARALKALNHPNIVAAIDFGTTAAGLDYLVMNYIEGRPLDVLWRPTPGRNDRRFTAQHFPEPPAKLRLFKRICDTVQAAHRKGITHRDLSPSNILLDDQADPHILDFGLASTAFDAALSPNARDVSLTGTFLGKLHYAAPEQARGRDPATPYGDQFDPRTDVYALGVILYQILTHGAFPYEVAGNMIDVLNNIIHHKPLPPSAALQTRAASNPRSREVEHPSSPHPTPARINSAIEAIVLKCLEKSPAHRYESAGALAEDINRYLDGQPIAAIDPLPKSPVKNESRNKLITAATIVVVASLITGVSMNTKAIASFLGLSAMFASLGAALPPEMDPGLKLDTARNSYELAVEDIRAQIIKVIDDKDTDLRTKKGTDDAIDKLKAQRDAFLERGELPTGLPISKYLKAFDDQRRILCDAYDFAADGYRDPKVKLDELRKQTRAEIDLLKQENDLPPWSANLLEALTTSDRTLDATHPAYTLPTPVTDPYRLEVTGKSEDNATIILELPTLDNKGLSLPLRPDPSGNFHAIVTVRPARIAIDMGIDRQAKTSDAEAGTQVAVRVNTGKAVLLKVRIKSIQKKPVVALQPFNAANGQAEPAKRAEQAARPPEAQKDDPASFLVTGSEWMSPKGGTKYTVTARSEAEVTIERPSTDGKGIIFYDFRIEGSRLIGIRSGYRGPNPRADRLVKATGTIKGKNLSFSASTSTNGTAPWPEALHNGALVE